MRCDQHSVPGLASLRGVPNLAEACLDCLRKTWSIVFHLAAKSTCWLMPRVLPRLLRCSHTLVEEEPVYSVVVQVDSRLVGLVRLVLKDLLAEDCERLLDAMSHRQRCRKIKRTVRDWRCPSHW